MRVVLDTNTIVSALFWQGPPRQVLELARTETIQIFTSPVLQAELEEVLHRPKFAERLVRANLAVDEILAGVSALCTVIPAQDLAAPASTDPDDDAVLACALASSAAAIVSGDRHLLTLAAYDGVPILTSAQFLLRLRAG